MVPGGCTSSWAQYTIQTENRDVLQARLKAAGIPSMVYYPRTMSQQTAFSCLNQKPRSVAERLTKTVLSLPMHPYMTDEEIEIVANTVLNND
jgi:dTDP-4-amino-4,6-dideoxygalactose transaminase